VHEEIRDDRWRYCAVRGLADPDQRPEGDEPSKALHVRSQQGGGAPQGHAHRHYPGAGVAITQISKDGGAHHIRDNEYGLQKSSAVISNVEVSSNICQYSCEMKGKFRMRFLVIYHQQGILGSLLYHLTNYDNPYSLVFKCH